ncbi:TetR/AcrR family transcriptional regulator [Streptomyces misionensis]|uniref:TetR/AcrR family transcriptional regulator n=1 Tax=Streptomyces misionensis TaxID=67331 RepID=A0A5C6JYC0_9ACTN|nr:TetR/AcrR family transcriptional regulator [Streptomyces misionensis]TWV55700.1 TetR/AcrR family transcriptional regulator [Streptomyces misionensis]
MTARTPGAAGRRRDAGRTREALLRAATDLFSERGFDRTTIRDIGERAGVDPALIARYFGSKTRLYLAALEEERGDVVRDVLDPERLLDIVDRVERRGLVPLLQVAVEPLRDAAAADAAKAALHARLVEPLVRRFTREGVDRPRLRAELVVAAVVGVVLGHRSGAFDELGKAEAADVAGLLLDTLSGRSGPYDEQDAPSS